MFSTQTTIKFKTMNAIQSLKSDYSKDEFKMFATHGCASSCPNNHWNYSQTKEFYLEFEGEILDTLEDVNGANPFKVFSDDCDNISHLMNQIVWAYIETISHIICDENDDNDGE